MANEERFIDPNTQESPIPEYNKIDSPNKNPYHETYDDRYFKEYGTFVTVTHTNPGCLIGVQAEFEGFDDPYNLPIGVPNVSDESFKFYDRTQSYDIFVEVDGKYINVPKLADEVLQTKINDSVRNGKIKFNPETNFDLSNKDFLNDIGFQLSEFWGNVSYNNSAADILRLCSLLLCRNVVNLNDAAKSKSTIENVIDGFLANCSPEQKVSFFIQPCQVAGVPVKSAVFKKVYIAKQVSLIKKEILEQYGFQVQEVANYNRSLVVDPRIFKEIPDTDFFDHDVFIPYVEDAYRLYTRIGEAFKHNGEVRYSTYQDPYTWSWSKEPPKERFEDYTLLQVKVSDLGLFPEQCNTIYRAAYYDYQEYLPKWCTPRYSLCEKDINKIHKEAVLEEKTKYVNVPIKELVLVVDANGNKIQDKQEGWDEDVELNQEKILPTTYSSSHKEILSFIPNEDYTGPFSVTMGTGHWYGWYIKEFDIDGSGNPTNAGVVIDGSAQFYYKGSYNGNNGQVTDNRQEVSQQSSEIGGLNTIRSNYVSYNGVSYDANNYNNNLSYGTTLGYHTVLQRYNFNLKVYNFIKQFENNHDALNSSSLHDDLLIVWKNELLNKKQELLTDSRRGTDSEWVVKRETAINNSWLKEIQEYIDDIKANESKYETYEDIVNWYLEKILDEKYQLESVSYNTALETYCNKCDLNYIPVTNPNAVSGGILVAPINPSSSYPQDNSWKEYATHNNNASLQINSFGNVTFHANKRYTIYTRECPGGGTDASKFIYTFKLNNDPDYSIKIKKRTIKDVDVYYVKKTTYKKPVKYMEEIQKESIVKKRVQVVDHMYLEYYDESDRTKMRLEITQRMKEIKTMVEDQIGVGPMKISEDYDISGSGRHGHIARKIAKFMHDYLIENCEFGESEFSRSFYSPLSSKKYKAESEGFALAYKFLCNNYGVPTQIVTGYIFKDPKTGADIPGGKFHAWNRTFVGLGAYTEKEDINETITEILDNYSPEELILVEEVLKGQWGSTDDQIRNRLTRAGKNASRIIKAKNKIGNNKNLFYNRLRRQPRVNETRRVKGSWCIIVTAGNKEDAKQSWSEHLYISIACALMGTKATMTTSFINDEFPKRMEDVKKHIKIWGPSPHYNHNFKNFTIFVQKPVVCAAAYEPDSNAEIIKTYPLTEAGVNKCISEMKQKLPSLANK